MDHKRIFCIILQVLFIIKLTEGASLPKLKEQAQSDEPAVENAIENKDPVPETKDKPVPAVENAVENEEVVPETKEKDVPVQLPEVSKSVEKVVEKAKSAESNESSESQESSEEHFTEENEVSFTDVKSQEDFDAAKFAGVWYHAYRLKWSHHKFVSEINFVKLQADGTLKAWSRHYSNGECSPTESATYTQTKTHKGDWSFNTYGGLKVLFTCYNHSVLYICDHVQRDGHCKKEHLEVEVLSRTTGPLASGMVDKMTKVIESVGLTKDEFEIVNNSVSCVLPGIPENPDQSCKVADYTSQENFDSEKFSGLWYEIERTNYAPATSWESGIAKYEVKEGHALSFSYAGTRSHKCRGPFQGYGKPVADNNGDLMMYFGQEESYDSPWSVHFTYKVLYTDYNVAITYTCMQLNEDGTCNHNGEQLAILSRTPRLDKKTRSNLYDIIAEKVCVDVYDLVQSKREEHCHKLIGAVDCSIRPMCLMYCELGFVKGNDGCDICKCKEPESQVESSGENESGDGEAASGESMSSEEDKASGDGESKESESPSETVQVIDEEPSQKAEVVEEKKDEPKEDENEAQNETVNEVEPAVENESKENEVETKPAVESVEEAPAQNESEADENEDEDENEVESEDENEVEQAEEEVAAAYGYRDTFLDSFKNWFN